MITTVLFDVGGVLEIVEDDNWPKEWMHSWFDRLGIPREEGWARLSFADLPDTTSAAGTELPYQQAVGRALGLTQTQIDLMFADMWDRYCGRPNTELLDLVPSLAQHVRCAILSNSADGARREEERRHGFSRLFDPVIYSHEIGVMKPDPAIFRHACELAGARPEQVVFIDDVAENVAAAEGVGMVGVLHTSNEATIARLRELVPAWRPEG